jgi:hypothetical protein
MRSVSQRFLASVRQTHQIAVSCELYFPGSTTPVVIPVEGGSLTQDRTALVRRTGRVTIPWSLDSGADLGVDLRTLPLGGYARISRGIRFPDGTVELASLGYLRVESATWLTFEDRASLELADRMAQVRDESFTTPYAAGGKYPAQAALEIVQQVFPPGGDVTYQTLYNPPIPLADVFYSGSRADALTALVDSIAGSVYFDGDGNYVFDGAPGASTVTRDGNLTDDSPVVTGLSSTSDLGVGMNVYGKGVTPGLRIKSVDSSSQITLTGQVNTWALKNARAVAGSAVLTMISDTTDLTVGMVVNEPHTPAGTTIRSIDGADQVTLSNPVGASTVDYEFLFNFVVPNPVSLTFTGQSGDLGYPVWLIDTGDTGVMVEAEEALDRTGVYNGVLVQGQNSAIDSPVSALVYDDDPTSPTRWGGPFGKVVRIDSSTAVQTALQASNSAGSLLDRKLGLTRSLVLSSAPNPALEAGDIVDVAFEDGRRERHVIDAIELDLGPEGAQRLSTRSVFTPAAGRLHADLPRRYRQVRYGRQAWREARRARRVRAIA